MAERRDGRLLTVAEALREGLERALTERPEVFVMGEGVTDPKGIFGTTLGLAERFGHDRILETPISENAFTGVAIGACSPVATRLGALEAALIGRPMAEAAATAAAEHLAGLAPIDDMRATAAYRHSAALELTRRALAAASRSAP